MFTKHTSKDFWLVKMLAGAAFAAASYFYLLPGSLAENLSLAFPAVTGQAAQLAMADNPHEMDSMLHEEHNEIFDLVPHSAATHEAVRSGNWSDPTVWSAGNVPSTGANVVIPAGRTITYDHSSDARIRTVRVDGTLTFASAAATKLVFDTMVTSKDSQLIVGTEQRPITGSVELVVANNGPIDTTWDKLLLSRGIVTHGETKMHGQEKYVHGKVSRDPMKGDSSISMAETPSGWEVGDTIVIAGTYYDGYKWDGARVSHHAPQDEVRTITAISGRTISFAEPLEFNHDTPRSDLKTSVANYTRNVTIRTENGSEATPTGQRGHVMFAHHDDVDVRYVALHELGRTDKAVPSLEAIEFDTVTPTTNVRGRYSLHIHQAGAESHENPAILIGNAVFGSPGWGVVHHDSNAIIHNNATYRTFGAGYVAETGNEIGTWTNNIAIYAKGRSWGDPKNVINFGTFDFAVTGDGFWFQGRMVKTRNNVAASVNNGYSFFHRSPGISETRPTGELKSSPLVFDYPEAVYEGQSNKGTGAYTKVGNSRIPILEFNNNEAFAANRGMIVTKANPNQGHDIRTTMNDFTAWSVRYGSSLNYTAHYILRNFDVVGREPGRFTKAMTGISFGPNVSDMVMINPVVDNFDIGIHLNKGTTGSVAPEENQYVVVNPTLRNIVREDYGAYDPNLDTIMSSDEVKTGNFRVSLDDSSFIYDPCDADWAARFTYITGTRVDGLGTQPIPAGSDGIRFGPVMGMGLMANEGYRTANGTYYVIHEQFFTDRATGEVHKIGMPLQVDECVHRQLGEPWWGYEHAFNAGPINLNSRPPVTEGEAESVSPNRETRIRNLLDNDTDPDGDELRLDGLTQPQHGQAFADGDDIIYRPDFDFEGEDMIKYWVTDDHGNYSPAFLTISVGGSRPDVIASPEPDVVNDTEEEVVDDIVESPTDNDADGIDDAIDNCVTTPNEDQADADNDGVGDACDEIDDTVVEEEVVEEEVAPEDEEVVEEPETITPPVSSRFDYSVRVQTTSNLNVRTGPGDDILGVQPLGSQGVVGIQNPIAAGDLVYIYVNFDNAPDGWVADRYLTEATETEEETQEEEPPTVESPEDTVDDQRVRTTDNLNVRAEPNGNKLGVQTRGAYGTIENQTRVTSAGIDWVYVNFDNAPDGWVADSYITTNLSTPDMVSESAVRAQIAELLKLLAILQAMYERLYGTN